jgi:hypothetical protein
MLKNVHHAYYIRFRFETNISMTTVLSNTTKRLLKESAAVRGLLADLFDKSHQSITRWIDEDNPALTAYAAMQIYKEQFNLSETEILEPETSNA